MAGVAAQSSKFKLEQSTTAPAGFSNSLQATVLSAYSPISTDFGFLVRQHIEGFNVADIGMGTSAAKPMSLSFWVRSSITGTYGGVISGSSNATNYVFTYSISSVDTWEYITILIPAYTSGSFGSGNGIGLSVVFSLGTGSNFLTTAGSWTSSTTYWGATGQTQWINNAAATWYITGVQLEVGSVATPFERRPYGAELALCQRYYYTLGGETAFQCFGIGQAYTSTQANGIVISFPTNMRAIPTFSYSSLSHFYMQKANSAAETTTALTQTANEASSKTGNLAATVGSGLSAGNATLLLAANTTSAKLNWSAEL
jgi:hypothetical protein